MDFKISAEHVSELLGRGAVALPSLTPKEYETLCAEARALPLSPAMKVTQTGVVQNFSSCDDLPEDGGLARLMSLAEIYIGDQLLNKYHVIDSPLVFNEGVVQVYQKAVPGQEYSISPHRDHKECINVVAVFVLEGEAPFCVCKDRQGTDTVVISNRPGDLVLMRGYGFKGLPRPFHFVGNVTEGTRISLGMRQLTDRTVMSNRS